VNYNSFQQNSIIYDKECKGKINKKDFLLLYHTLGADETKKKKIQMLFLMELTSKTLS
jgi:hypothetical protein